MTDYEPAAPPRPSRRLLWICLTPIAIATIGGWIATAIGPALIVEHPLWMVALDPRSRTFVLTQRYAEFEHLVPIAIARRLILDPFLFTLGRLYGKDAVGWVTRKFSDMAPIVKFTNRWFPKFGWIFVLTTPGLIVCTMAGATGMSVVLFVVCDIVGTVAGTLLVHRVGDTEAVGSVTGPITNFLTEYRIPMLIFTVTLVATTLFLQHRKGKTGLDALATAEEELGVAEDAYKPPQEPKD